MDYASTRSIRNESEDSAPIFIFVFKRRQTFLGPFLIEQLPLNIELNNSFFFLVELALLLGLFAHLSDLILCQVELVARDLDVC